MVFVVVVVQKVYQTKMYLGTNVLFHNVIRESSTSGFFVFESPNGKGCSYIVLYLAFALSINNKQSLFEYRPGRSGDGMKL